MVIVRVGSTVGDKVAVELDNDVGTNEGSAEDASVG